MNLLFVYSAKFKKDNIGNLYTDSSLNDTLWERYTKIADQFEVISRMESTIYDEKEARIKFNLFSEGNKSFTEIPNITSGITNFISWLSRKKLKETIKKSVYRNDVIIARLPSNAGYIAVKYAKQYKKPYLVEVVGCPRDALWNHSFKGKLLSLPRYLSMKRAIKDSPYALYVTKEFLQNRYPSKGKTIGCSDVVLTEVNKDILKSRLEKIKKMSDDSPVILGTAAAIDVKYKGQQYVIKAISILNKQGYHFEYHLAGGGDSSYLQRIAKKYGVSEQVKFLGPLPHKNIFQYLQSIDVYIQPSKLEGLPRALIEAMSLGCPSLGSRVGGIPELLSSENLFNSGSITEIKQLLKNIDKNFLEKYAMINYDKAKEYEKNTLEKRRQDFFEEFIEEYRD